MWKGVDLGNDRVLNFTNSIRSLQDFSRVMENIVTKKKVLVWIVSKPWNKEVFEKISSILHPQFNNRQKQIFIEKGGLLFNNARVLCCFQYGRKKEFVKQLQLHVVTE